MLSYYTIFNRKSIWSIIGVYTIFKKVYCVVFFIFSLSLVCAKGNTENRFKNIDSLIQQKNYNDALVLLDEHIRKNPNDFDLVQTRIKKIMTLRQNYADTAENLLDVLVGDPANDERKLKMIAALENMESNPNELTKAFILQTKQAAQFTYNRALFEHIMTAGSDLAKQGKYAEAAQTFYSGFSLYRDDFYNAGYESSFLIPVNNSLHIISDTLPQYVVLQDSLEKSIKNLISAIESGQINLARQAFTHVKTTMKNFADLRNAVFRAGFTLQNAFGELVKKNPQLTEASFLPFVSRFTLGKNAESYTGITGVMDSQWVIYTNVLQQANFNVIKQNWNMFTLENAKSIDFINTASSFAQLGIELDSLHAFLEKPPNLKNSNGSANSTYVDTMQTVLALNAAALKQFTAQNDFFVSNNRHNLSENNEALDFLMNTDNTVVLAAFTDLVCGQTLQNYNDSYEKALQMLNGIRNAQTGIINFYPAECAAILQNLLVQIPQNMPPIQTVFDFLQKTEVPDLSKKPYKNVLANIKNTIADIQNMPQKVRLLFAKANEQVFAAKKAFQEADLRYNLAESAYKKNNFIDSRENLEFAREKYSLSLALQESPDLRSLVDTKLAALGALITKAENEVVVVQVRSLINQAKKLYYAANFESANRLLNQAKTRWAMTNIEENTEITQWLTLTAMAIERKTGQTIPVTAPLYPEMSQLLNVANQMYNQGTILFAQGNKTKALEVLDIARQKIREVQLVYPVNQEALILSLKIDKMISPQDFEIAFKQRFESAMANYKKIEFQQSAYSDLLGLYQINPNYAGLKTGIETVEIFLGIRLPPPDKTAIARANTLVLQARQATNTADEIQLRAALAQLDEALKLMPDNAEAAVLKDRIQSRVGGQALAVLSSESERLYQNAVQELQQNNVINAAAILAQLIKNPQNKKSPKVLDLQQRINTLTGQAH